MIPASLLRVLIILMLISLMPLGSAGYVEYQVVQDLKPTANLTFIYNLKMILDSYRYTENYSAGQFDCVETCMITQKVLREHGYQVIIIERLVKVDRPGKSHGWLAVPDGNGGWAFVETTIWHFDKAAGLGGIVYDPQAEGYTSGITGDEWALLKCWGLEDRVRSHMNNYEKQPKNS
jgi:hypothetical protein